MAVAKQRVLMTAPYNRSPLLAVLNAIGMAAYLAVTGWGVLEVLRFIAGVVMLWGPLGLLLYRLLATEVPDRIVRGALSVTAAYALTTVIYFTFAVVQFEAGFYVLQAAVGGAAILPYARAWRAGMGVRLREFWESIDWVLTTLVTVSILLNIPYQIPVKDLPDRVSLALYEDHLYHVGQVYELARHVPPRQQAIRAGVPERAYHMFSHLTTMLLG
ncbi:MAG TPA: hypothetical protein VMW56_05465, partial [Candidatus Margulisiibacteriota bacterium]|nr:hypothetical protein [Candidatus Margulisiibacteriota bacterium]